jgi:hypothetical protein
VAATAVIHIGLSVANRNVFRGKIAAPGEQYLRNLSPAYINAIYNDWNAYTDAAIEGVICHDGDAGCGPGTVDFDPFITSPSPLPTPTPVSVGGIAELPAIAGKGASGMGGATYAVLAGAAAGVLAFAVLATLSVKRRRVK